MSSQRIPEIHLFVLWEHARPWADRIVADIRKTFRILDAVELRWTTDLADRHFSRLYGQWLPSDSQKLDDCGSGAPLIIVVSDDAPHYGWRRKWGTTYLVNTHLFDAKQRYRARTRASSVHCTTSVAEAEHDLFLLLGRRSADYADRPISPWDGSVRPLKRDLTGDAGWSSIQEMFTAIELTLDYVRLPIVESGAPIRLLETGLSAHCGVEWLISEPDRHPEGASRRRYPVLVNGQPVMVDLHGVGQGRKPRSWQEGILRRRVRDEEGTFVLSPKDAFLELWHELVMVGTWSQGDARRLAELARAAGAPAPDLNDLDVARQGLDAALRERGYDQEGPKEVDGESSVPPLVAILEPVLARLRALRQRLDPL